MNVKSFILAFKSMHQTIMTKVQRMDYYDKSIIKRLDCPGCNYKLWY